MKAKLVLLYTALGGVLLGFVAWRIQTPQPGVPLSDILVDRSESMQNPCSAMAGLIERQVTLSRGEFAIFTTGAENSAHEPVLLPSRPAPTQERLIKSKRRLAQDQRAFVRQLQVLCSQQPAALVSPIYLGVQQAVAHLRGAAGQVDRQLFVISDLRENFNPRVKRALGQPLGTKAKLPALLRCCVVLSSRLRIRVSTLALATPFAAGNHPRAAVAASAFSSPSAARISKIRRRRQLVGNIAGKRGLVRFGHPGGRALSGLDRAGGADSGLPVPCARRQSDLLLRSRGGSRRARHAANPAPLSLVGDAGRRRDVGGYRQVEIGGELPPERAHAQPRIGVAASA